MSISTVPVPLNEIDRLISLSEFDVDYSDLRENFKDLSKLAAKITGMPICFVSLIDSYTFWSIADYGVPVEQVPREESICQYVVAGEDTFEVKNLEEDDRFKDRYFVTGEPHLKSYFGVPLKSDTGHSIGSLCVFDNKENSVSSEKVELLRIIAGEVVNRLKTYKIIDDLKRKVYEARNAKMKVAHDIRGPLSGIIGLTKIVSQLGDANKLEEVLQFNTLIERSSNSLLELAEEILTIEKGAEEKAGNLFNLAIFKDKLEKLYLPQTIHKNISFAIYIEEAQKEIPVVKNKLLQIAGNLISNAIKFTPVNGKISVGLNINVSKSPAILHISVSDTGVGLDEEAIDCIINGKAASTSGTEGEFGYGFGLELVKHLVVSLHGTLHITSKPGEGAIFNVFLPQTQR